MTIKKKKRKERKKKNQSVFFCSFNAMSANDFQFLYFALHCSQQNNATFQSHRVYALSTNSFASINQNKKIELTAQRVFSAAVALCIYLSFTFLQIKMNFRLEMN